MNRNQIVIVTLVVLAALGVVLYFFNPFAPRPQYLILPGIVEVQEVRLGSKVGGRVARVDVLEGAEVYAGQPLVTFEVPELKNQRDQQQAKLDSARADLEKARNGPRPQEKDAGRAAAESAWAKYRLSAEGFREEEKRQAQADLAAAEADAKQAQEELERITELYRQKSVARADYDVAVANRGRNVAKMNALKARFELVQVGNRPEEIQQALQDWKKAQSNYELLLAGTRPEEIAMAEAAVNDAKAKLDEIDTNLRESVVYAAEKAIVEAVAVRKGDLVPPNQPIVRVLRAEDLWVKVFVPETEFGRLRLNQQADVRARVDNLKGLEVDVRVDSEPTKQFVGKVIQVATISEYTPRNVQSLEERRYQVFAVKVRIADPQGVFKSGMAAEVRLPLAEAH